MSETLYIAALSESSLELRVVFQQQADRWEHRIVVVDPGGSKEENETVLLRSVEGTSEQAWPPCPPLQDASRHSLPTGDALLAVGMAGTSHWSASFSIEKPEKSNGEQTDGQTVDRPQTVLADLACLFKKDEPADASSLGSSYELGSDAELVNQDNQQIQIKAAKVELRIDTVAGDDWSSEISIGGDRLQIRPNELSADKRRATRWGFRLSIV